MLKTNIQFHTHQYKMEAYMFLSSIVSYFGNKFSEPNNIYILSIFIPSFLTLKNINTNIVNIDKNNKAKNKNNKVNKLKFQTETKDNDVSIAVEVLNRTNTSYVYKLKTKMFEYLYIVSSLILVSGNKNVSIYSWQRNF